jgi:hypothetical protein
VSDTSIEDRRVPKDEEEDEVVPLDEVFDGAFGGVGEQGVLWEGGVLTSSSSLSLVKSMNMVSCGCDGLNVILFGGLMVILGFLEM